MFIIVDWEQSFFFFRFSNGSAQPLDKRGQQPTKKIALFFMLLPSHAFSHVHVLLCVSCILLYELRKKRDGL